MFQSLKIIPATEIRPETKWLRLVSPIYVLVLVKHTLKEKTVLFTRRESDTKSVYYFENELGKSTDLQAHHYPTVISSFHLQYTRVCVWC